MHNCSPLLFIFCSFCRWGEMIVTIAIDFTFRHWTLAPSQKQWFLFLMFPEKKHKLGEWPWMEVVSLSGTIWWPEAYFTKWVNGKPKSVNHEMRETLGFLSHSVSYKKSNLKKGATLAGFINKCSSESVPALTDLWPQPGRRQDLFNKSRISLSLLYNLVTPSGCQICVWCPPDQHFQMSLLCSCISF